MRVIFLLFLFSCAQNELSRSSMVPYWSIKEMDPQKRAFSKKFMVVSQGPHSSEIARSILKKGGNAFDAFVALSFAISVERPQSTGIGGGGFALFTHPLTKKVMSLDFREQAPKLAYEDMYLDKEKNIIPKLSINGSRAVAVPTLIKGILEIHKKYASLPLKTLIDPAIKLARDGFPVYPHLEMAIKYRKDVLFKNKSAKKIFFKNGRPLKTGDTLKQKDLAKTLINIREKGLNGFYKGEFALSLIRDQKKNGGLIRKDDLKNIEVKYRKPVSGKFKNFDIYSMAPPSSGGIHIIQILNILEKLPLETWGPFSKSYIHYLTSAMQFAFHDRAKYLGDSDFVKVPIQGLISKKYAEILYDKINPLRATKFQGDKILNPFSFEKDDTTHFTIVDKSGTIVSSTQTINGLFGSGVIPGDTGVILNNEMDDFSSKVGSSNLFGAIGGKKNAIRAYKRPLSSMSPSIVLYNDQPVLALGSPSGTRILTCVAQVILNNIIHKLSLWDSVSVMRVHHQWRPDYIRVDEPGLPDELTNDLEKMGYKVKTKDLGCKVQAIAFKDGGYEGVSDPRGQGSALGL